MKHYFLIIFVIFLLAYSTVSAQEYLDVTPDYKAKFPDDLYYKKDYRIQWWYFTGHLFDEKGREFGYELTFFAVGVQKRHYSSKFGVNTIYISHFAISDVKEKKFYFKEKADSGAYNFAGAKTTELKVWIKQNALEGTIEQMHLKASEKHMAIDLELTPQKPLVLNGGNGYSRKSEESAMFASIYFSYTSLKTSGTLKVGDEVFDVNGKSWFDREISAGALGKKQSGWDWFAIQLDDAREIMLYIMRNKDGSIDRFSSGTFVDRNGSYKHLTLDDFSVKALDRYTSKKTDATYPSRWEIRIFSENLALTVNSLMDDQEVLATFSTGNYYWEGTCTVKGSAKGRAYVELTGY
ncbi:MAG TPA: carotenoid 1,2-hydratase [Nitrospiraceae bacterium]|jgi:predicted secreted hydrolase|nr:carotenoid 1,2-hydratase [Nitrospiraceae bacterium]